MPAAGRNPHICNHVLTSRRLPPRSAVMAEATMRPVNDIAGFVAWFTRSLAYLSISGFDEPIPPQGHTI